nr:MOB kinase activator 2 isoform X3 [Cavia porcellus]
MFGDHCGLPTDRALLGQPPKTGFCYKMVLQAVSKVLSGAAHRRKQDTSTQPRTPWCHRGSQSGKSASVWKAPLAGAWQNCSQGSSPGQAPRARPKGRGVPGSSRRLCLLLTEHEVDQKLVWDPGAPSPLLQSALPCSMAPPEEDWAQPMWLSRKSKAKPNGKKPAGEEKKVYLEPEHTKSRITDFEFKELVMLPREIDLNEWLASNTTTFFHHINLQYSTISEFCTGETCQTMAVCNTTTGMTRGGRRSSAQPPSMSTLS